MYKSILRFLVETITSYLVLTQYFKEAQTKVIRLVILTISDIRLVISAILGTSTPSRYFDRPNFTTRVASMGKWIVAGFFISLAYKEILLSTLVTTTYAKSINTINDMLNSKV